MTNSTRTTAATTTLSSVSTAQLGAFGAALLLVLCAFVLAGCVKSEEAGEADVMAELHEGDSPDASAMASEPNVPVVAESVTYGVIDGTSLAGYMARPEAATTGSLPGVILIHEWWGLNDNIKTTARRLAGEGYRVLAVDLYKGRVATTGDLAQQYMGDAVANPEQAMTNIRSASAFLRENHDAPNLAVMGWCFGGGQAANAMVAMPASIDATVIYYGNLPTDRAALAAVESPVLAFFGSADAGIPVDGVRAFESTMNELGKDVDVTIYEGAGHAFANPSGQSYDDAAASDAWMKTLQFLEANLKGQ